MRDRAARTDDRDGHGAAQSLRLDVLRVGRSCCGPPQDAGDDDEERDFGARLPARLVRRFVPVTEELDRARFFVRREGQLHARPVRGLVMVELTDVVFGWTHPAILGVTRDPFIVFTSNAFAILGLRSAYFAVAA